MHRLTRQELLLLGLIQVNELRPGDVMKQKTFVDAWRAGMGTDGELSAAFKGLQELNYLTRVRDDAYLLTLSGYEAARDRGSVQLPWGD